MVGPGICRQHDGSLYRVGRYRSMAWQKRGAIVIGIAIGGFLGAVTRYIFYLLVESRTWQPKVATWLVNSIGSLVTGLFLGVGSLSAFWITGFLGAFTTFSTMALDVVKDIEDGNWLQGCVYILATLVSGLGLFGLGYSLIQ